ncbi:MAG: DcaP family trimeric outer membrane transporter [Gammaproteobacteria bacterium]
MPKVLQPILLSLWLLPIAGHADSANEDMIGLLKELKNQIQGLKNQVDQSNARIDQLEKALQQSRTQQRAVTKNKEAIAPASQTSSPLQTTTNNKEVNSDKQAGNPAITLGDIKGTYKIPGTDTSVGIGGYVKMDTLINSVTAGRDQLGNQQLIFSQIPVDDSSKEHSQTTFHAKETRLWFKSFTPNNWGDINTYLEMDFFGDAATYTYTPRLRHGYGTLGNFLGGQTWTTFLNVAALPESLDAIGVSAGAVSNFRQPMIRWTQPFMGNATPLEIQFALESPRSRVWVPSTLEGNGGPSFITSDDGHYPDFVGRLNFNPDWGILSLAALARQIRYTQPSTDFQQDNWGAAVNLAGKINTIGFDNIRFMLHYGNGEGRYVTTSNTFGDAALDADGQMDLIKTFGGMLSYQRWWNKQWRSTLIYGFSGSDQPNYINTELTRQVQSLQANLLWSPVREAMMGIEYIYAARQLIDYRDGALHRVQLSARYNF